MFDSIIYEVKIDEVPKWIYREKIRAGMNCYLRLHWTQKKHVKDLAQNLCRHWFKNIPKMDYIEWEWSWSNSRFDNDNRHFFWIKMAQDVLKGEKIKDDSNKYINHCLYYVDFEQKEDLIVRIYGRVKAK